MTSPLKNNVTLALAVRLEILLGNKIALQFWERNQSPKPHLFVPFFSIPFHFIPFPLPQTSPMRVFKQNKTPPSQFKGTQNNFTKKNLLLEVALLGPFPTPSNCWVLPTSCVPVTWWQQKPRRRNPVTWRSGPWFCCCLGWFHSYFKFAPWVLQTLSVSSGDAVNSRQQNTCLKQGICPANSTCVHDDYTQISHGTWTFGFPKRISCSRFVTFWTPTPTAVWPLGTISVML